MQSEYKIELAPNAQRQLKKLSKQLQLTIIQKLEDLKITPLPVGIKKLSGINNLYRLRIGNYRVIYQVEHKILLILVLKIGDRKEVYDNLKALSNKPS
ncbi:addiction module toxin, RelE/StbE family protein [Rickettsia hoogstraalii str. RCCE3]|uniref:type II toxin-antitoxin system RelE family toxin n=1 Tax=Rickettsia hoogstraalii TaxID=467174 RepID=UPI0005911585|nr:type II toxin-antitoxin system RelE/ParE family toxin [Rickettsia hoogstraalii]KJV81264.1 addiction module toxin, RelE/StbE family protein [Rickettsia hoogstraalii str. RCCE3]